MLSYNEDLYDEGGEGDYYEDDYNPDADPLADFFASLNPFSGGPGDNVQGEGEGRPHDGHIENFVHDPTHPTNPDKLSECSVAPPPSHFFFEEAQAGHDRR